MIQTQGPGCPCMFCRSTSPRKSAILPTNLRIVRKRFPIGAIFSPKTVRSFCPFFNGSYRLVDQRWINSSNTDVDRFKYGYDRNSNRTYKENTVNTGLSEVYTNDDLNQIASYKLGTLNTGKTDVTGTATNTQSWDYDATGNWDSITTNSTTQTRGANKQNEITSVSGATTPTFDNNGNLTKDENNYRFVYDAWNRQVIIKNASDAVITTNSFNGIKQNIKVVASSTTIDRIFSNGWQLLEEKSGSNTVTRNVWSPVYVDALVLRDRDTDANGTLDERLVPLQDANFNVTAITNTSGTVQERYTYTPFGVVTYRDASGSSISSSTKAWVYLHQGGQINFAGDYDFRNRVLSPTLGRWLTNDPLGFDAGDVNTFRYEANNSIVNNDPLGLLVPMPGGGQPPRDKPGPDPGGLPRVQPLLNNGLYIAAKEETKATFIEGIGTNWGFRARVKWGIKDKNGNADSKANGWIIQHVVRAHRNYSTHNYSSKVWDTKFSETYWEAWEVKNGVIEGSKQNPWDDTFTVGNTTNQVIIAGYIHDFKITGLAKFIPNPDLGKKLLKDGWKIGGVLGAGTLLSSPEIGGGGDAMQEWRNTPGGVTHELNGQSNWEKGERNPAMYARPDGIVFPNMNDVPFYK